MWGKLVKGISVLGPIIMFISAIIGLAFIEASRNIQFKIAVYQKTRLDLELCPLLEKTLYKSSFTTYSTKGFSKFVSEAIKTNESSSFLRDMWKLYYSNVTSYPSKYIYREYRYAKAFEDFLGVQIAFVHVVDEENANPDIIRAIKEHYFPYVQISPEPPSSYICEFFVFDPNSLFGNKLRGERIYLVPR